MQKMVTVARREFFTNVRRPSFIFVTLLFPILSLFGTLSSAAAGGSFFHRLRDQVTAITQPIGFIDHSGALVHAPPAVRYPDQAAGLAALHRGDIGVLIVIPPDYLARGGAAVHLLGADSPYATAAGTARLREFFREALLSWVPDPMLQARLRDPLHPTFVHPAGGLPSMAVPNPVAFLIPIATAILLVIAIFTSSGFMLHSVSAEKENRIMEVLLSSVSATDLLIGKILGLGALGLLQALIWFAGFGLVAWLAVATLPFPLDFSPSFGMLALAFVYFLLGYLVFATLMAILGSVTPSLREGQQLAALFSIAAASPLALTGVILTQPHGGLAYGLSLFPLTSPMMMLLRTAVIAVPPWELALSLALLLGFLLLAMWGGARIFRAGVLMVGKRLTLTEILRATQLR